MLIDIRGNGPYKAFAVHSNGTEVFLFNAGFYETAVYQAFARAGEVRLNNQPIEDPYKKRKDEDE